MNLVPGQRYRIHGIHEDSQWFYMWERLIGLEVEYLGLMRQEPRVFMLRFINPPEQLTNSGTWNINTNDGITQMREPLLVPVHDPEALAAWTAYDLGDDP